MHRQQVFRAVPHTLVPIGGGYSLMLSRELSRVLPLGPAASAIVRCCRGVQTSEQHLFSALDEGCPGDADAVRTIIDAFVATGILQPCAEPGPSTRRAETTVITTVAVITADRPGPLARCLHSCVDHFRAHEQRPRLLVIDGSKGHQHSAANRCAVGRLGYDQAEYVGASEAESIRRRLVMAGCSAGTIEFALGGGGTGANRNLALLLTLGEELLMIDDDVVLDTWVDPNLDSGVTIAGHHELRHVRFHSSRVEALGSVRRRAVDLLANHSVLLGKQLTEIGAALEDIDSQHGCPSLLSMAAGESPGRVRVTCAGIAGDSGVDCPSALLFDSGSVRAHLTGDEGQFSTGMSSREITLITPQHLVSHTSPSMPYCMGLSHRELLPPFLPFGRSQDGLFGVTLGSIDPTALFGHVPVGIVHDSDRESAYGSRVAAATTTTLADLMIALTHLVDVSAVPGTAAERLGALGRALEQHGNADLQDFVEHAVRAVSRLWSVSLTQAETLAGRDPHCPQYWRDALGTLRQTLMESVQQDGYFVPPELQRDGQDDPAEWQEAQTIVRRMGEMYCAWTRICEAAAVAGISAGANRARANSISASS